MPVAAKIQHYLQSLGIQGKCVLRDRDEGRSGPEDQALSEIEVLAALARDDKGALLLLYPVNREIDWTRLNARLQRNLQPLEPHRAAPIFSDCQPGELPALGKPYGLRCLADSSLRQYARLQFPAGCIRSWLQLEGAELDLLLDEMKLESFCSEEAATALAVDPTRGRLETLHRLPPMPATAQQILQLAGDCETPVDALCDLIERDPSLTAQILREAKSPLYGFRGTVATIRDAVVKVLGYERVGQLALVIAASRAFSIPAEGRLGLQQFWRHSLHCAVLSQQLARQTQGRVDAGEIYLAALLHNFGILVMGHLFRPEYRMLSRLSEQDPEQPIGELESRLLAMGSDCGVFCEGHGRLGAALLDHWRLPKSVVDVARMHQDPNPEGDHSDAVRLVRLANALLKEMELGDDLAPEDPEALAAELQLPMDLVFEVYEQVKSVSPSIDAAAGEASRQAA